MGPYDYLTIGLSLLLFKFVNSSYLGYWVDLIPLNYDRDINRNWTEERLRTVDRRFFDRWIPPFLFTIISLFCHPLLSWKTLDPLGHINYVFGFLCCLLAWKAATMDIDLATGKLLLKERLLLAAAAIGTFFFPGFAIFVLYIVINVFCLWRSHEIVPLRLLQVLLAYLAASGLVRGVFLALSWGDPSITVLSLIFLCMCVISSHYFLPGLNKMRIGEHWYTWPMENEVHNLFISCYLWGWLGWLPQKTAIRICKAIKPFDRTIQTYTLVIECGAILALLHPVAALFILGGAFCMHLGIFLLAGIWFWEYMCTDAAFFVLIYNLAPAETAALFNVGNEALLAAIVVTTSLYGIFWQPLGFFWLDSPYVGRVHWHVIGRSGKVYGLYSRFMSPHEFHFGYTNGEFLLNHKIIHRHEGEYKDLKLWRAVMHSKGDWKILRELNDLYGRDGKDPVEEKVHEVFLLKFFRNFNAGNPKRVCPWWMKAPGEVFNYWGRQESFQGQEPVAKIIATYREEYFDGETIKTIRDYAVKEIIIE